MREKLSSFQNEFYENSGTDLVNFTEYLTSILEISRKKKDFYLIANQQKKDLQIEIWKTSEEFFWNILFPFGDREIMKENEVEINGAKQRTHMLD